MQYLNKPGKEEYEGDKIEVGTPARKAVNCSIHEEHPAFLGGSLVDCEYTGACRERGEQTELWRTFEMRNRFPEKQSILIHVIFSKTKALLKGPKWHATFYCSYS